MNAVRDGAFARVTAVLGFTSMATIALASLIGLVAFGWPLVADPQSGGGRPLPRRTVLFAVVVPLLLLVVLARVSDGSMDAKAVAMLGVLAAVIAALRPLGGGTAGIEPIWVVLVLGGRALGPGFGFSLGAVSMLASALGGGRTVAAVPDDRRRVGRHGAGSSPARRAGGRSRCSPAAGRPRASPTASASTCGSGRSPRACRTESRSSPATRCWPT
ncbi:MAG: ECF transporter S component [Candidatus Nanopelagicales bacterium]